MNPLERIVGKARDARARHAARHTPTGFGFALADGIDSLDARRWDELVAGKSVFLSRAYLEALATAGPENLASRFAIVFRGKTPVAAVAAQSVDASVARVVRAESRRAAALKRFDVRLLVCGNLLSWGPHGVAFAKGEDPRALWPAVAEALYRIRRADKLHGDSDLVMVKDALDAERADMEPLSAYSYRPLATEPNMVLALAPKWRTLDDYAKALVSKYARAMRKVAEDLDAAGCTCELLGDVAGNAERLHALYMQVHEQQPVRLFTLRAGFLPALASAFGERLRVSAIRKDGAIVGFISTLADGDDAIGYFLGFDKALAEAAPLYLRLLHLAVGDAIALRAKRLSLGRTALTPKAALGAKPEAMHVWVRHRVPALNVLLRSLLGAVHHAEAPERDPFKKDAKE